MDTLPASYKKVKVYASIAYLSTSIQHILDPVFIFEDMQKSFFFFFIFGFIFALSCQETIDGTLKKFNNGSVAYISPGALKKERNVFLLDARKIEEFETSHLKDAIWVGYNSFNLKRITSLIPEKEHPIVVYCSVGVRSEDIGEKLKKAGYTNVKNLYGGIFLWKNLGYTVYDNSDKPTEKVHVFGKEWAPLLTNGKKIYSTQKKDH